MSMSSDVILWPLVITDASNSAIPGLERGGVHFTGQLSVGTKKDMGLLYICLDCWYTRNGGHMVDTRTKRQGVKLLAPKPDHDARCIRTFSNIFPSSHCFAIGCDRRRARLLNPLTLSLADLFWLFTHSTLASSLAPPNTSRTNSTLASSLAPPNTSRTNSTMASSLAPPNTSRRLFSPVTSLVLTDSSQLTSDSQHLELLAVYCELSVITKEAMGLL
uniref:Uncharacterized protein n=1 Tax=Timema monikensis TaxID=170555 RepID=A0A7R9HLR2_9NEOP|nr:unnamed protein product [Timema monikensis]